MDREFGRPGEGVGRRRNNVFLSHPSPAVFAKNDEKYKDSKHV